MSASPSSAEPLQLGAAAPDVIISDHDGNSVHLASVGAEGLMLVYFYPKADTPGCTRQACSIRDAFAEFQASGIRVFGVSSDDAAAQRAFREKFQLPFVLLADTEQQTARAFGVPLRGTFASRQAFLFRDGTLIWRDLSASTDQQAQDVLQAIAETKPGES